MELYYNLLGVYNPNTDELHKTKLLAETLLETGYVEDDDVVELAKKTDSVLLVEVEQDDGYMEFITVTNKGKIKSRVIFDPNKTIVEREKVLEVGFEDYFSKKAQKMINKLVTEYEMTIDEFIHDALDSYFMDLYEMKKEKMIDTIHKNYKE